MKNCIIEYLNIAENKEYNNIINNVVDECFKEEKLDTTNLYISITLTDPKEIRNLNNEYRHIDKETDVLSFPMFEKSEIENILQGKCIEVQDVLGDIIISIPKVEEQAKEYGHSFERELSYMLVHGFYHLIGYDHMEEEDKKEMRTKEEKVLKTLNILR